MTTAARAMDDEHGIEIAALGLAGESGEFAYMLLLGLGLAAHSGAVADHVKKWIGQGHAVDFNKLDKEAGDILWYLARYAHARGKTLGEIAAMNAVKLHDRYPEGFQPERSLNRGAE